MDRDDFAERVSGIATLAEPVRRDLYLYVSTQPTPVSRDEASQRLGIPRHTAKFHLDRLVAEGLLATDFKRLSERRGPGAGRPTKLYRRSDRQLSVTLPERRYDLAARLMARAIDESRHHGTPVTDALHDGAAELGAGVGAEARTEAGARPTREDLVNLACERLSDYGYEPRRRGDSVVLANCPFDALARDHTELACGMNLALLDAMVHGLAEGGLVARLDPAPDRCCVVLTEG